MSQIGPDKYKELLLGENDVKAKIDTTKALDIALAARQFEIDMYLKRTTYFWTILGAALAGYFAIQSISPANMEAKDKQFYSFTISVIGAVISLGWCMANKGSKYWHENWENHVMVLTKEIVGPIFNITLSRPESQGPIHSLLAFFTRPGKYSVTKINVLLSWFMFSIWISLLANSFHFSHIVFYVSVRYFMVGLVGISAIAAIIWGAKSFRSEYLHVAEYRDSSIASPPGQGTASKSS